MGIGAIPWSSIDRYAVRFAIDDAEEFQRFSRLIRVMDRAYCAHIESLQPDSGKQ